MKFVCTLSLLLLFSAVSSQRTVGVLSYDENLSSDGFNLIYPLEQSSAYLIDNCGNVVHTWEGSVEYNAGTAAYLLPDGNLIRTCRPRDFVAGTFSAGGAGGVIQIANWDDEVVWHYEVLDAKHRAHHDVEVLPSGHVLIIAWEKKSKVEMIEAGWDTVSSNLDELWSDYIIEVDPLTDSVVWEWHAWDHLIQNFDPARDNYGSPGEHPHRIHVNADTGSFGLRPDWLHINSIDYHEERDQIILSVPHFSEVWVVDHSTTTIEAGTSSGGRSGAGGDLLFRWGNPMMYDKGSQEHQRLFFQHDAQWHTHIAAGVERNAIMVYNNRKEEFLSEIEIFLPDFDAEGGAYQLQAGVFFADSITSISHPQPEIAYSSGMSGAQFLDNGNLMVCSSRSGYAYELNESRELVWEYIFPFRNGALVEQGAELQVGDNRVFNIKRYSPSSSAFVGRDLSSHGPLELDGQSICIETSSYWPFAIDLCIYPNPTRDYIAVKGLKQGHVKLINLQGQVYRSISIGSEEVLIDVSNLSSGIYLIWNDGRLVGRAAVKH